MGDRFLIILCRLGGGAVWTPCRCRRPGKRPIRNPLPRAMTSAPSLPSARDEQAELRDKINASRRSWIAASSAPNSAWTGSRPWPGSRRHVASIRLEYDFAPQRPVDASMLPGGPAPEALTSWPARCECTRSSSTRANCLPDRRHSQIGARPDTDSLLHPGTHTGKPCRSRQSGTTQGGVHPGVDHAEGKEMKRFHALADVPDRQPWRRLGLRRGSRNPWAGCSSRPERRLALERQRTHNVQQAQALQGTTMSLDGVVYRSSGKSTVWINQHAQNENDAKRTGVTTTLSPRDPGAPDRARRRCSGKTQSGRGRQSRHR
jgi:hypothetical protein